jgi:hypothetical protein
MDQGLGRTECQDVPINTDNGNAFFLLAVQIPPRVEDVGILPPDFRDARERPGMRASTEAAKRDLPIVCTNGRDDALSLADRNFRDELTGFRPYRSRERNDVVMTSFPHKMICDGMEPERFLSLQVCRRL